MLNNLTRPRISQLFALALTSGLIAPKSTAQVEAEPTVTKPLSRLSVETLRQNQILPNEFNQVADDARQILSALVSFLDQPGVESFILKLDESNIPLDDIEQITNFFLKHWDVSSQLSRLPNFETLKTGAVILAAQAALLSFKKEAKNPEINLFIQKSADGSFKILAPYHKNLDPLSGGVELPKFLVMKSSKAGITIDVSKMSPADFKNSYLLQSILSCRNSESGLKFDFKSFNMRPADEGLLFELYNFVPKNRTLMPANFN